MLCTAVFRHRKLFFEEGGQGGISSQVHKWQFCVSRVTFDLGHVFGWSLPGYKFPREASCKWVRAHWSVKWHQKTQKWSSINPPNASQGCLAKRKKTRYFLQLIFNVQLTLSKTDTFGTGTKCPSYRESNKRIKEKQGPTLSVHFTEVSIL